MQKLSQKKIKELLSRTETAINSGVDIRVDFIPDPQEFIEKIRGAYAIKSFKATFTGPNPIDADELFQKPLSVYAQQIGAQRGVLDVQGESLNEAVVESVAKSTAATANMASARIIPSKGSKPTKIKIQGDAISVPVDKADSYRAVLGKIQLEYKKVRE
ncbi:hypothetical protein [Dickeya dadantii]|uniref:hypothetical protein n=1 Tax=Dickeya dadantii TaxID=204038 RepID=UPI0006ACAFB4|nr:hypothetical protein [Dickeya dadantii]